MLEGGPDLGKGSLAERLARMRSEHDHYRSAIVNEPRGSDIMVGALLCEPVDPTCGAGVIFFNDVGYLGMCGHGMIGLVVTLAWLGRISPASIASKRRSASCRRSSTTMGASRLPMFRAIGGSAPRAWRSQV